MISTYIFSLNLLLTLTYFTLDKLIDKTLDMVIEEAFPLYNLKMVCKSCKADMKELKVYDIMTYKDELNL